MKMYGRSTFFDGSFSAQISYNLCNNIWRILSVHRDTILQYLDAAIYNSKRAREMSRRWPGLNNHVKERIYQTPVAIKNERVKDMKINKIKGFRSISIINVILLTEREKTVCKY